MAAVAAQAPLIEETAAAAALPWLGASEHADSAVVDASAMLADVKKANAIHELIEVSTQF